MPHSWSHASVEVSAILPLPHVHAASALPAPTSRRRLWPRPALVPDTRRPSVPPTRTFATYSDASLVELALAGDGHARAALFARYTRMVRAMAAKLSGSELADDVAQDSFLEALSALDRIGNPHAFKSWLLGLTARVARRRFRAYGSGGKPRGCDAQDDAAHELACSSVPPDVALELKDMGTLLASLPDNLQHALRLRRIDGLKLEQVALELGVSLATVKRWLGHVDDQLGTPTAL